MNIKNYTSSVPVERSIMLIEKMLNDAGALSIIKHNDPQTKEPAALIFSIMIQNKSGEYNPVLFKLPSKIKQCYEIMLKNYSPRSAIKKTVQETCMQQAKRTAWKLLNDWVAIQVSMIQIQQVEPLEVFLPYAYNPDLDQTFFENVKENGYKLLTSGK